jgi:hypothetical protein
VNTHELAEYARHIGATFVIRWKDEGIVLRMEYPGMGHRFRFYEFDDPQGRIDNDILRWLNSLPWPTEDDPRVQEEGVTL